MKYTAVILALALISTAIAEEQPATIEQYITDMVEMGIDAGINACLVNGVPRNKYALEVAKARSKALVQALYPETKWVWKDPQPLDPQLLGEVEGENVF